LVLSVTRILRAALTKFRVYVCICNYSSQTTEPICTKIIPPNRAPYADSYRLLKFQIFTPTIFKTPKNNFLGPLMLNQWELVRPIQKSIGKYSRFMAQTTWLSPRIVLFGVRTMSDIIRGKCAPK